jgi:peptide/nickel transport system permease protein
LVEREPGWQGPDAPESDGSRARRRLGRLLRRSPLGLLGAIILIVAVLVAIFAPALAPHSPTAINILDRLKPPGTPGHPLGTDSLGRDILSRLIFGSRISLTVGISAVAIAGVVGIAAGLVAGYYGGWVDDVIMRIVDIQLAFPFILLAIAMLAVFGAGLINLILVLGVGNWVGYARLVRGEVLSLREKEFIEAARATGARGWPVMARHVLPNIIAPVIVVASFAVASTILTEAALEFLGLGLPPAVATWGSMLSDGQNYLNSAWWLCAFPGLAIMVAVLGINLLGDWLRDVLDPRLRGTL